MKIEDELHFTKSCSTPSGGCPPKVRLTKDYDINTLIGRLQEKDISIDRLSSRRVIGYEMATLSIPLNSSPDNSLVVGYSLKSGNLEIELKDYSNRTSEHAPGSRTFGGSVTHVNGVVGSIKFNGTYEEGKIVETAKKVLGDYHYDRSERDEALVHLGEKLSNILDGRIKLSD
ncbi:MAG: hypothetical protein AABW50_02520 [Nanoarchaeota archaeon]